MSTVATQAVTSLTRPRASDTHAALTADHTEDEWRFLVTEPWSVNQWIIATSRTDASAVPTLAMRFPDESGRLAAPVACGPISGAARYGTWGSLADFEAFCLAFAAL